MAWSPRHPPEGLNYSSVSENWIMKVKERERPSDTEGSKGNGTVYFRMVKSELVFD
jgi:hypothetical protein